MRTISRGKFVNIVEDSNGRLFLQPTQVGMREARDLLREDYDDRNDQYPTEVRSLLHDHFAKGDWHNLSGSRDAVGDFETFSREILFHPQQAHKPVLVGKVYFINDARNPLQRLARGEDLELTSSGRHMHRDAEDAYRKERRKRPPNWIEFRRHWTAMTELEGDR
jgi:hypothetical protein